MLDPQVADYLDRVRALRADPVWDRPLATQRSEYDTGAAALFGEPDPVARVEDLAADGVPVRVYTPQGAESADAATVYFLGGGWVVGSLESHDRLCQTLAARSGRPLLAVDYRLAPENVFPAAIEDAWTATHWARRRYRHLAVAGDSAGGQLAASVALRARDENIILRLQVLIYPVTDNSFDTDSYADNRDPAALTEDQMRWFWAQYLPETHRGVTRDFAPLQASDLGGVAPALIITAQYDPLRDEGELYADRLKAAGVTANLERYDGMVHGFIRQVAIVDAAERAVDQVAAALRTALAGPHG
jgi:acetyl esterase